VPRYLVFGCTKYYPLGGWDDFRGSFNTLEDAEEFAEESKNKWDWIQIVDLYTMERVDEND
jgi:hypothetical protein